MFTGIITDIGQIMQVDQRGDLRVRIGCTYDVKGIAIGASIACSGACLTVVGKGQNTENAGADSPGTGWFDVDISAETVSKTAKDRWVVGGKLNLERALKVGDELGGHIVTGHVDAVGHIMSTTSEGDSMRVIVRAPKSLAPFIAAKGSITVDGVSLTVNSHHDQADGRVDFGLNIIPHTAAATTFGSWQEGDELNLEIDVLARYLKRMQSHYEGRDNSEM